MTSTDTLIHAAQNHLAAGADLADDAGDARLAAQIRLAAATLPAPDMADGAEAPPAPDAHEYTVVAHLSAALECLDAIHPLAGPADLQLSAWHLHELRRIAAGALAS